MHQSSLTQPQRVAVTIVCMTSGSASFVASTGIIVSVLRSRKKLKDTYRRLIFGMSVCDALSSFAFMLRPFKMLPDEHSTWLTLGNQASCDALTYIQLIGIVGAPMYSVGLSIYYFYLIKRNMRQREFRKSVEPYLHGVPILWTVIGATYGLVANMYNPGHANECFIAAKPLRCDKLDEVECERGGNAAIFAVIYIALPILLSFFLALGGLLRTYRTIRSQELLMNKYRISMVSYGLSSSLGGSESSGAGAGNNNKLIRGILRRSFSKIGSFLRARKQGSNGNYHQNNSNTEPVEVEVEQEGVLASALAARRMPKKKRSKGRGFLNLSVKYVTSFALTYVMTFVVNFIRAAGKEPPFWLFFLERALQPLQGAINIFVYTSPHVRTMRDIDPELSWFRAFCCVVMNGGDDDLGDEERRQSFRNSRRNSRKSSLASRRGSAASISSFASRGLGGGREKNNISNNNGFGDINNRSGGTPETETGTATDSSLSSLRSKTMGGGSRRRQSFVKNTNRGDINSFKLDEKCVKAIEKGKKDGCVVDVVIPDGDGNEGEVKDEDGGTRERKKRVSFVSEYKSLALMVPDSNESDGSAYSSIEKGELE